MQGDFVAEGFELADVDAFLAFRADAVGEVFEVVGDVFDRQKLISIVWMRSTTAMSASWPVNLVRESFFSSIEARCFFCRRIFTRVRMRS